jgi:hypothetical protein
MNMEHTERQQWVDQVVHINTRLTATATVEEAQVE